MCVCVCVRVLHHGYGRVWHSGSIFFLTNFPRFHCWLNARNGLFIAVTNVHVNDLHNACKHGRKEATFLSRRKTDEKAALFFAHFRQSIH